MSAAEWGSYESVANGETRLTVTFEQALREVRKHSVSAVETFEALGYRATYDATKLLRYLGY